jgi:hypothetical protein
MKLRLYLDEDAMDNDLVKALRSQGIELVTAFEADMVKEPDEAHLRYATSEGLALYSFNIKDYVVLHSNWLAHGQEHAGLILANQRFHYSVGEQMRRLSRIVLTLSTEEMKNRLEYLSSWNE